MVSITYIVFNMNVLKAVIKVSLYLALGDSITAGYGVGTAFSFPTIYGDFLRRHDPDLSVHNMGINGLTTQGLLELLYFHRGLRQLVAQASLITITVGSNDLLRLIRNAHQSINASRVAIILANMDKMFALIGKVLRQLNPRAMVKVATLYNPLPAGPYAQYYGQVQGVMDTANALLISVAKRYGLVVVYVDREIRGKERSLIGLDYGHPNVAGYRAIAKAFARY